jgi:hypothetical protein
MAISNHTLGDYITIKTIIENPSDISYNKYPKKSKNFDKTNNNNVVLQLIFWQKKLACALLLIFLV